MEKWQWLGYFKMCLLNINAWRQQRIKLVILSIKVTVKVTRSLTLVSFERVWLFQYACKVWSFYVIWKGFIIWVCMEIWSFHLLWFKSYGQSWTLRYVGQRSLWRSLGQNYWHDWEHLITRNLHEKHERSTCNGSKVMAKVKVLRNVGQRSQSVTRSLAGVT